jgi:hypothetical protein
MLGKFYIIGANIDICGNCSGNKKPTEVGFMLFLDHKPAFSWDAHRGTALCLKWRTRYEPGLRVSITLPESFAGKRAGRGLVITQHYATDIPTGIEGSPLGFLRSVKVQLRPKPARISVVSLARQSGYDYPEHVLVLILSSEGEA